MSRQRVNFGFKQVNQQRNQLKTKPTEFLDYDDEQYTDFNQQNKKRMRESQSPKLAKWKKFKQDNNNFPIANHLQLTDELLNHYIKAKQLETTYTLKWKLCQDLFSMFVGIVPNLGVYLVGSSANGFATEDTDADICIVISSYSIDQKREAVKFLEIVRRALRKKIFVGACDLIRARVPILRFTDYATRLRCDVNINNVTGIRNTDLLRFYAETDERVAPLVLTIKTWAKFHNINDASQKTLSSYSLTLMCLFYLQGIAKPSVVPVWQAILPDRFDTDQPVSQLKRNDEPKLIWKSENRQTIGELFIGFLKYFSKDFRYEKHAISVRTGSLIDKEEFLDNDLTHYGDALLAIEEPFDFTNTARSVYDDDEFERIVRVFRRSYFTIEKSKSFSSILTEQFT
jgi:poly(A) RNA polymerase GLD2